MGRFGKIRKYWFVYSFVSAVLLPILVFSLIRVSLELRGVKAERKKDLLRISRLEKEIGSVRDELSKVKRFDLKLRIIANLTEKGQPMGGILPPKSYGFPVGKHEELAYLHMKLDQLEDVVSGLRKETQREEKSLSELFDLYRKKLTIIAYTPSIRPTAGYISSGFGWRVSPFTGMREFHKGIDVVARPGTPVVATADGVVIFAGRFGGYGNTVIISHRNGFRTLYAHLRKIVVKRGQRVRRGQVIGTVGSTGLSTGPHLHYEVRYRGKALNPRNYILD